MVKFIHPCAKYSTFIGVFLYGSGYDAYLAKNGGVRGLDFTRRTTLAMLCRVACLTAQIDAISMMCIGGFLTQDLTAVACVPEKHGVSRYLKEVVALLLENRPEEPIEFITEYLRGAVEGTNPLKQSYRFIRLSRVNTGVFVDNLYSAFATMAPGGTAMPVSNYSRLLSLLCADFPPDVLQAVLAALERDPDELLDFEQFAAGITACLLYDEFMSVAKQWFSDSDGGSAADTAASEAAEEAGGAEDSVAWAVRGANKLSAKLSDLLVRLEEAAAEQESTRLRRLPLDAGRDDSIAPRREDIDEHLAAMVPGLPRERRLQLPPSRKLIDSLTAAASPSGDISYPAFVTAVFRVCGEEFIDPRRS